MPDLEEFRKAKDHFMSHDPNSPLTQDQKTAFSGLKYFTESSDLRFVLPVDVFDSNETIEMQTSTGGVAEYLRWGEIHFEVDGESAQLTIYSDAHGHGHFLPFADATSGNHQAGSGPAARRRIRTTACGSSFEPLPTTSTASSLRRAHTVAGCSSAFPRSTR